MVSKLLLLLLSLACTSDEVVEVAPVGTAVYLEGMWSARALTVGAGLDEARTLYDDGRRDDARALVEQVYAGSFEPELERAARESLDPRTAAELEYGFGRLQAALARPRNGSTVEQAILDLKAGMDDAAGALDRAQAVVATE